MRTIHGYCVAVGLLAFLATPTAGWAGIANTKHNLSVTGPGAVKATSEKQLCIFCHAPHNAAPAVPLWNHAMSAATYTPYSSMSMAAAAPGQPTGASKLCLSCHDGTVAVGGVQHQSLASSGTSTAGVLAGLEALLSGVMSLGSNLRDDHPVSFTYDTALLTKNPELVSPAALTGKIKPDGTGQVQCSSCHDPHSDTNPKFLHLGYQDAGGFGSPMCLTCHDKKYWNTLANNSHRTSTARWNGLGNNPWHIPGQNLALNTNSTPKANGCESCHQPHAATGDRLLKAFPSIAANESSLCLNCHNGNVANPTQNIDAAMSKTSHHPSKDPAYAGRHTLRRQADGTAREDQADLANANRHAECVDCHNPHAASPGTSPDVSTTANQTTNVAPPVIKGVWGVQPTWGSNWTDVPQYGGYTVVSEVQYIYQLCFKCHSSYAFGISPPPDPNMDGGFLTDLAKEFNPNNKSFHPVVTTGKNDFKFTRGATTYDYGSSLIIGGTAAPQTILHSCTDCHSNKDPLTGEAGPKGPHGTNTWPISWAPYNVTTGMTGTSGHLCFKCHAWSTYADGVSKDNWRITGFSDGSKNLHSYHVFKKDMTCTACHSAVPHGMSNRALLVFGVGTKTPAPYNNHAKNRLDGSTTYGIPSTVGSGRGLNLDTIASGNWIKDDCHGSGSTNTGSCK